MDPFESISKKLISKKMTLTFAESCTGGLLAKSFTDIPGVSEVFSGSVVTYSNDAKQKFLGVDEKTLEKYGAVSKQTAYEMAKGARLLFSSDIAVAVTGIAGPDGGSDEKPVGLVYIGISTQDRTKTYRLQASDKKGRKGVRCATVKCVCRLLEEELSE